MFFSPLTFFFILIFFFSLLVLFFVIQINLITLAFAQIGIPSRYIFFALLASLFGSFINIPVKTIPQERITDLLGCSTPCLELRPGIWAILPDTFPGRTG